MQQASCLSRWWPVAIALFASPWAKAADYTWNLSTDGAWDTTSANWSGTGSVWANGSSSSAIFNGTAVLVTANQGITANTLTFDTSGFTLRTTNNSTLTLAGTGAGIATNFSAAASVSINIGLGGTDGFTKSGTGRIVLNTAATYTGTTSISGGVLQIASGDDRLPIGTDLSIASGASLVIGSGRSQRIASLTGTGSVSGTGASAAAFTLGGATSATFTGVLSNGGAGGLSLTKTGTGTQTLGGSTASSFSGGTAINEGTLVAAKASAFGTGAVTVASGSTWGIQGNVTQTNAGTVAGVGASGSAGAIESRSGANSLSGALTLSNSATIGTTAGNLTLSGGIAMGGNVLTLNPAASTQLTISGAIGGGFGELVKNGTGTGVLSAANTYIGTTTINAGTLYVNGSIAYGGSVLVSANSTLGGSGRIDSATTVAANGRLSPGSPMGILTIHSALTLNADAQTTFAINGTTRGTDYTGIDVSNAMTFGGTLTLDFSSALSGSGTLNLFQLGTIPTGNFSAVTGTGQHAGSFTFDSGTSRWTLTSGALVLSFNPGNGHLTYGPVVAAPVVSAVSPAAGPLAGSTVVTITGTDFTGVTAVTFGATAASSFTFNSATQITATSPAGSAGAVDVRVTTPGGTSATSASAQFTYVSAPTITTDPTSRTAAGTQSTTFTVGVSGAGPLSYQWYFNNDPIPGQNLPTLTLPFVLLKDAGAYKVQVTNAGGSATSAAATLKVGPYVTNLAADRSVGVGGKHKFFVTAQGSGTLSYQWYKVDGSSLTPIGTATSAEYTIDAVTGAQGGAYKVIVSHNEGGDPVTSEATTLTVLPNPILTTVTATIADANGVTGYLSIEGTASKKLILAVYGPALTDVSGAISDPQVVLENAQGTQIAAADNFAEVTDGTFASTYARFSLPALTPTSKDAVIYGTLPAGAYRVRITGVGGATGAFRLALVDTDHNPQSRVAYVALRAPVSTTAPITGTFQSTAYADKHILVRAVGPGLGASGLAQPTLTFFDTNGTTVLDTNSQWGGGATLTNAFTQAGAFALASDSKDAVLYSNQKVGKGVYTGKVTAAAGSGDVLWEYYDLNGTAPATYAPIIVLPPVAQTVSGGNVTFRVVAAGGGTLTYVWKHGTTVIPSATTATLSLTGVTESEIGNYTVEVTNSAGTAAATAALKLKPAITSLATASATYGSSFTFNVTGSASPTSYGATDLPTGLSINTTTGAITGTPTVTGLFNATVSATNADGTGSATLAITVGARPITVTANSGQTKVYGDSDPTYTYTITTGSLYGSDTLTGALSRATGESVNTYAITQGTLAADSKYTLTFAGGVNFSITPRPITVAANSAQSKVYGDVDPTFAYTLTSGSLVGGDTLSGALARNAGEGVGAYAITQGSLAASGNYTLTYTPGVTFAITARPITVTANAAQGKTYGATEPSSYTYSITSGSLAFADTLSGALTRTAGETVGSYPIGQGSLAASANYSLTYAGASFSITPRPITVSADSGQSKVYGAADPANYTYAITTGSLAFSDTLADVLSGALTRATGENVGPYAIGQGTLAANGNYALTYSGANFAITPKAITITANSGQSKTYGASDPGSFTYTVPPGSLIGSDAVSGSLVRAAGENAGAYAINQGSLTAGSNYSITYVGANFTINPAVLTVTADNLSRAYGSANPTFTSVIAGFVGSDNLANSVTGAPDLTTTATMASPQGTYPITVALNTLAAANYTFSLVDGTLTVTKAALTVAATAQSKVYGTVNPAPAYTITGYLNGDTTATAVTGEPVVTHTATAASAAGSHPITVALGTLAAANYTFTLADGTLTITPAVLTVTADDKSMRYNRGVPVLTATITGFVNGDTAATAVSGAASLSSAGNSASPVGTYAITAAQGTLTAANYTFAFVAGTLTISKASVDIAFANLQHVYDGTPKQATITATPNVPLSVTYSVVPVVNAGSYTVIVSVNDDNYGGSALATLTIAKAPQTLAISATGGAVGTSVPVSATSSAGLPVSLAVVSGGATISGGSLTFTAAGPVILAATQAGNGNYAAATLQQTVEATGKRDQIISFGELPNRQSNASAFALTATASSGLPVSYTVAGPAMLDGAQLSLTGTIGVVRVTASQAGDATWNAAPSVTREFAVTPAIPNVFMGGVQMNGAPAPGSFAFNLLSAFPTAQFGSLLLHINNTFSVILGNMPIELGKQFQFPFLANFPGTQPDAAGAGTPARAAEVRRLTLNILVTETSVVANIVELPISFSAPVQPVGSTSHVAGFYQSNLINSASGSTATIIGNNGEVLTIATVGSQTIAGASTLTASGTFTLAAGGATLTGAVDASSTTVSGAISVPGQPTVSFSGLASSTTRTDRMINLSSRVRVAPSGDRTLITGFVIGGTAGKRVLLRAVGPALAGFGLGDALANPRLELYDGAGRLIQQNDDWSGAETAAAAAQVGAFALPAGSRDAAMLATLAPGAYTMQVRTSSETGVALAEIYDASVNPQGEYQRLVNISSRGAVEAGDGVLVGGFVVTGNSPKKMLIRGVGPALAGFGLTGTLADPRLTLHSGSAIIARNDNWGTPTAVTSTQVTADAAEIAAAAQAVGAFTLAAGSRDAALIVTLAPGAYTAQVSAADGAGAGVALVEIYEIP